MARSDTLRRELATLGDKKAGFAKVVGAQEKIAAGAREAARMKRDQTMLQFRISARTALAAAEREEKRRRRKQRPPWPDGHATVDVLRRRSASCAQPRSCSGPPTALVRRRHPPRRKRSPAGLSRRRGAALATHRGLPRGRPSESCTYSESDAVETSAWGLDYRVGHQGSLVRCVIFAPVRAAVARVTPARRRQRHLVVQHDRSTAPPRCSTNGPPDSRRQSTVPRR